MRGVYTKTQEPAPEVSMQVDTKRYTRKGGSISLGTKVSGANDLNTRSLLGNPMRKRKRK